MSGGLDNYVKNVIAFTSAGKYDCYPLLNLFIFVVVKLLV